MGTARGRIRELEDERATFSGAADELAGFKRSKVWSTFEIYAAAPPQVRGGHGEPARPLSPVPAPDLSLIVVGAGPFGAPPPAPELAIEIVDCGGDGAEARRGALARRAGRFVAFVDAGDHLHPDTPGYLAPFLAGDRADLVYTDDDVVDGVARHSDPFLKPSWSPDRLLGQHYLGRLTALRRDLVLDVAADCEHGGDVFEHDLALRVTELTDRVEHLPVSSTTIAVAVACRIRRPPTPGSRSSTRRCADGARPCAPDGGRRSRRRASCCRRCRSDRASAS